MIVLRAVDFLIERLSSDEACIPNQRLHLDSLASSHIGAYIASKTRPVAIQRREDGRRSS